MLFNAVEFPGHQFVAGPEISIHAESRGDFLRVNLHRRQRAVEREGNKSNPLQLPGRPCGVHQVLRGQRLALRGQLRLIHDAAAGVQTECVATSGAIGTTIVLGSFKLNAVELAGNEAIALGDPELPLYAWYQYSGSNRLSPLFQSALPTLTRIVSSVAKLIGTQLPSRSGVLVTPPLLLSLTRR